MLGRGDALAIPLIIVLIWCYSSLVVLLKVTDPSPDKTAFKVNLTN